MFLFIITLAKTKYFHKLLKQESESFEWFTVDVQFTNLVYLETEGCCTM